MAHVSRDAWLRCLGAIALLALLTGDEVQTGQARLNILWRSLVVSYDSPATQTHDETASAGSLYSDAGREATDAVVAAVSVSCARAIRDVVRLERHWLGSRLTRSPPSAPTA